MWEYHVLLGELVDKLESYRRAKEFFCNDELTKEQAQEFHDYLLDEENSDKNWKGMEVLFHELVVPENRPSLESYVSLTKMLNNHKDIMEPGKRNDKGVHAEPWNDCVCNVLKNS